LLARISLRNITGITRPYARSYSCLLVVRGIAVDISATVMALLCASWRRLDQRKEGRDEGGNDACAAYGGIMAALFSADIARSDGSETWSAFGERRLAERRQTKMKTRGFHGGGVNVAQ
jgi:hypothetical protein